MLLAVLALAPLAWLIVERSPDKPDGPEAFGTVLAIGATLIAYQQWRDARHEATLEKFYDRLDLANQKREAMADVSKEGMHLFTELDNLEYVIEKYKLGYANSDIACRGLRTFQSRCRALPDFASSAKHWVREAGYRPTTVTVVDAAIAECGGPGLP